MRIIESSFRKLYQEYLDSGLSVRDFCANQNFAVSTFYNKKKQLELKESAPEFIPLHVGNHPVVESNKSAEVVLQKEGSTIEGNSLEFTFPNGTKLQVRGQADLALLKTIVHLF
jgi:hypothetical protein